MQRLLRILKWTALTFSTLLFATSVFFWVRSIGHKEMWEHHRFEPNPRWTTGPLAGSGTQCKWGIWTVHGHLWLRANSHAPYSPQNGFALFALGPGHHRSTITADAANLMFDQTFRSHDPSDSGVYQAWSLAGVGYYQKRSDNVPGDGNPAIDDFFFAIPFWMLTTLFALWPLLFTTRRLLRRKHSTQGLCPACGYDLRATPNRCPECGRETNA